jgi:hypothetical protein
MIQIIYKITVMFRRSIICWLHDPLYYRTLFCLYKYTDVSVSFIKVGYGPSRVHWRRVTSCLMNVMSRLSVFSNLFCIKIMAFLL